MIRDKDRYNLFTRRSIVLAGGQLVLLSALTARLYYLQVVESAKYQTLAEDNRISLRLLAPQRGIIVDRNGVPVAENKKNFQLTIIAERSPDLKGTLERIGRLITLDELDRKRVLREASRQHPAFMPLIIRKSLSWEEVARIEIHVPDLPGVQVEVGQSRYYPYGQAGAHLIGYVGAVSPNEDTGDPLLELPSFEVGKNGIEKTEDLVLRGKAGRSEVEVDAYGRVVRDLSRRESVSGDEVRLTVDIELQEFAHTRLGDQSGAVVVLDVERGEVLALASAPAFDPNAFTGGISHDYWHELMSNERGPLSDKAIAGQYAPGSTFKPIVALAGLESGLVTADQKFFCPGYLQVGNMRFHCWKKNGHGWLDMEQAIEQSCDVYFYHVAKIIGVDRIAAMAKRFGLGHKLGIDLPGEKPGLIPTRNWKRAIFDTPWHLGETLITGIGQGYVLATPLQLAVAAARIANGKFALKPRLILDETSPVALATAGGKLPDVAPPTPKFAPLGVAESSLDVVRRGMWLVSNDIHGTAYRARIKHEGWEIAGKTGTSQVRRISKAEREHGVIKDKNLPWRERDHALFIAFAPADAPRYVVSVVIEHGGGGPTVAAPIARDVMEMTLRRDPLRGHPRLREASIATEGIVKANGLELGEGPP